MLCFGGREETRHGPANPISRVSISSCSAARSLFETRSIDETSNIPPAFRLFSRPGGAARAHGSTSGAPGRTGERADENAGAVRGACVCILMSVGAVWGGDFACLDQVVLLVVIIATVLQLQWERRMKVAQGGAPPPHIPLPRTRLVLSARGDLACMVLARFAEYAPTHRRE